MKSLKRTDALHLKAAEGWLDLDNEVEAEAELNEIAPQTRKHPDVLEVRWKISARGKKWDLCVELAETLADTAPRRSTGWLYLAASLHALQQTEEAYQTLVEIAGDFQDNAAISYQLACYASELNLFEDARLWLEQALVGVGSEDLKRLALKDPALQGLWNQLKKNEDDD
jgi:predicted Zn-dependent protease